MSTFVLIFATRRYCMDNSFLSGNLMDTIKKTDKHTLQTNLNLAIYMLKKGDVDELAKLLNSVDLDLLISKLHAYSGPNRPPIPIQTGH